MALWSGRELARERRKAGVALDGVAWLLGLTFLAVVAEIEEAEAVSQQVSDDYLAAVDLLSPLSETMRRYYRRDYLGDDPREERERLEGRPRDPMHRRQGQSRARKREKV